MTNNGSYNTETRVNTPTKNRDKLCALHNRKCLFHWWHMLFIKCAYDNKHVSITDLLKVPSLFHQHALNCIGGVMVNLFAS